MIAIERIGDVVCTVGESPVWCEEQSALYWVDIPARKLWRLETGSGLICSWEVPEMLACIALTDDGNVIAGMESGIFCLQLNDGGWAQAIPLARPDGLTCGMRFNDGRCDRQGRFWAGTMYLDMAAAREQGCLYRYDSAAGMSAPVVSDLIVQNGLAWSPNGDTMYLSDSHASRRLIWAFDYDIDSGIPSRQRIFVDLNEYRGRPDGAAVDIDGCYWTCANDAGCLLRFTPAGRIDRSIELPMKKPSMCAFGGAGMDTLYVTSIGAGSSPDDEWAGATISLRPGTTGLPEVHFKR